MKLRGIVDPRRRATTSRETLVIVLFVIAPAVLGTGLLAYGRTRGIAHRAVCGANLKSIGTAMKIYANENEQAWYVPGFDESEIGRIRYTMPVGGGAGTRRSPDRRHASRFGRGGATELSTTRAFWWFVRTQALEPAAFVCPKGGQRIDRFWNAVSFYDFVDEGQVSYGFQVPFGPPSTRAGEWGDARLAVAADRGPFESRAVAVHDFDQVHRRPHPGVSENHGAEGQNILFLDGHAEFSWTPSAGVHKDNIYTVATSGNSDRIGESPWERKAHPRGRVDENGKPLPTFDSVIFP